MTTHPLADGTTAAPRQDGSASPPMPAGPRILVVDDDPDLLLSYRRILAPRARRDAHSRTACAAEQAAVNAAQHADDFDVVVARQGQQAEQLASAAIQAGRPFALLFLGLPARTACAGGTDARAEGGSDGVRAAAALWTLDPRLLLVIVADPGAYDLAALRRGLECDWLLLHKPFGDDEVRQLARTLTRTWERQRQRDRLLRELDDQVARRTRELTARLRREQMLVEIAGRFIDLPEDESPNEAVTWALARIGRSLGVDVCSLIELGADDASFGAVSEWRDLGIADDLPRLPDLLAQTAEPLLDRCRRGLAFMIAPEENESDETELERNAPAQTDSEQPPWPSASVPGYGAADRVAFVPRSDALPLAIPSPPNQPDLSVLGVPILLGGMPRAILGVQRLGNAAGRWDRSDLSLLGTIGHVLIRALDQHRLLLSMRQTTERLALAQERARIGHCEIDGDTGRIRWSEMLYRMVGIPTATELDLDSLLARIHPDDRDHVVASIESALHHDVEHDLDYRILSTEEGADGKWLWLHCRASRVSADGDGAWRLSGIIQDITPRKRLEAALRIGEERSCAVFEQAGTGMGIYRGDRIVLANAAAAALLGYSTPAQLEQKRPDELSPLHQPDGALSADRVAAVTSQALAEGSSRFRWMHLSRTGEPVCIDVTLTRMEADGEPEILFVWRLSEHCRPTPA